MSQALQTNVQKTYGQVEATWFELASRTAKVLIVRQDMRYREVAAALTEMGVQESSRSLEGKIHRGTFPFSFFLQLIVATKSYRPLEWREALEAEQSWQHRASSIIQRDMAAQRWLTYNVLSRQLRDIGVIVSPPALHYKFRDGTLSAALFLQYATIRRLECVSGWVCWPDLNEVAAEGGRFFEAGDPVLVEPPGTPAPYRRWTRRWTWKRRPAPR